MPTKHPITLMPIQSQTGHIKDVRVYRKGRRCPICHGPLSMYTEGPYCLAHEFAGAVLDMQREEAHLEKMEARKRKGNRDRWRLKQEKKRRGK